MKCRTFLVILLLFSQKINATLKLELNQGISSLIPIVVTPFKSQDSSAQLISDVIKQDLENCGEFLVIYQENVSGLYKNLPQNDIIKLKKNRNEFALVGSIASERGIAYLVKFQLIDFFGVKPVVIEKEYRIEAKHFRMLAHLISDQIYQYATGFKGIFSTMIAYVAVDTTIPKQTIYRLEVSDFDGYNPQVLVRSREPLMSPAWSPNGREIAFVSFEKKKAEIYTMDIYSGKRVLITSFEGLNSAPSWSPDGKYLALVLSKSGSPNIYVFDMVTKALSQLTQGSSIDTEPVWSPDGKVIYFSSNRGGKSGEPQIYKLNLSNSLITRVTFWGNYNASPKITPDGKQMVFLHKEDREYRLAVQNLTTGNHSLLTDFGHVNTPSISPNGRMVIFSHAVGPKTLLNIISLDGRIKINLPAQLGNVYKPAWSPYLRN